jgi:DNA-binding transcriptional regulator GbsR (MarR family)
VYAVECYNKIIRTYGKIAGFWVITQKPLIISEILHGVKMISTARSTYSVILK